MKTELALQIQAYLDNELSADEARQIEQTLKTNAEAQSIQTELRAMKAALIPVHEAEMKLPESHDFHWSKIRRAIESEKVPAPARVSPWWFRVLAPIAGVAAVALVVMSGSMVKTGTLAQSNATESDTGVMSFHSQDQNMTVVWVSAGGTE